MFFAHINIVHWQSWRSMMINISESAKEALQTLMASIDEPIAGIRVLVKGGGCSGLQYDMALEEEKAEDDFEIPFGNGVLLVDSLSMTYLAGASIDYIESAMAKGFRFENPNASASCSCGQSFAAH